jgi:hypothetical protein
MSLVTTTLITEDRRIVDRTNVLELLFTFQRVAELELFASNTESQPYFSVFRKFHWICQGKLEAAYRPRCFRTENEQLTLTISIGRDCQIEEVETTIVCRQACKVSLIVRRELDDGFGVILGEN